MNELVKEYQAVSQSQVSSLIYWEVVWVVAQLLLLLGVALFLFEPLIESQRLMMAERVKF